MDEVAAAEDADSPKAKEVDSAHLTKVPQTFSKKTETLEEPS